MASRATVLDASSARTEVETIAKQARRPAKPRKKLARRANMGLLTLAIVSRCDKAITPEITGDFIGAKLWPVNC